MIRSKVRIAEIFTVTSIGGLPVSWNHSIGVISEIQTSLYNEALKR